MTLKFRPDWEIEGSFDSELGHGVGHDVSSLIFLRLLVLLWHNHISFGLRHPWKFSSGGLLSYFLESLLILGRCFLLLLIRVDVIDQHCIVTVNIVTKHPNCRFLLLVNHRQKAAGLSCNLIRMSSLLLWANLGLNLVLLSNLSFISCLISRKSLFVSFPLTVFTGLIFELVIALFSQI